jgi:hypothetical protein
MRFTANDAAADRQRRLRPGVHRLNFDDDPGGTTELSWAAGHAEGREGRHQTWRESNGLFRYATATHDVAVMRHSQLMVSGGRSVVDH